MLTMEADTCAVSPRVFADKGVVRIESRSGMAFRVTPDVAIRMSQDLIRGAAQAAGQGRLDSLLDL